MLNTNLESTNPKRKSEKQKQCCCNCTIAIQKLGGEVEVTSRSTGSLVFDDVDFVNDSKLLKHCEELCFRHVLRYLTYEQLHALLALLLPFLLRLRHYCHHTLSLSLTHTQENCLSLSKKSSTTVSISLFHFLSLLNFLISDYFSSSPPGLR